MIGNATDGDGHGGSDEGDRRATASGRAGWLSGVASVGRWLACLSLATVFVGTASAHGAGLSEFEAPLPLPYLFVGAGATVALTAVLLGLAGTAPEGSRSFARLEGRWASRLATAVRLGFLGLVTVAVVHGLVGRQVATANLATVVVWPLWLKGVAVVAILAGSPWRTLSPGRTLYGGLSRLEGRPLGTRSLPAWVGAWPAFGAFVLLVALENLTTVPREPAATAGLVAAYLAIVVAGSLVFGREWFRRGDPLEVFYRLLGRVAPLSLVSDGEARGDGSGTVGAPGAVSDEPIRAADGNPPPAGDRVLVVRPPWREAASPVADRAVAALVVAAVYAVSFDGFVETPTYQGILFAVRGATGAGPVAGVGLFLAGLFGFLGIFLAVAGLTGRLGGIERPVRAVAPTLLPIAAAYEIAHTYPFVAANLGRVPAALGGHAVDPLSWLTLSAFWGSQVVLVVAGHVIAVIAAHQVVSRRTGRRETLLAHFPLVVLMVGYTVLSLWIVSQPVAG